ALPPLTLAYVEPQPENATVVAIADAPARVLGETSELDDVDGDGLADLLVMDPSLDGGQYSFFPNLDGEHFGSRQVLDSTPSVWLSSAGVQLADMDGDGAADVVARVSAESDGFRYYPAAGKSFGKAVTITPNPSFAFNDADVRLADLNHDRRSDWLRIDPTTGEMSAALNQGGGAFGAATSLGRLDAKEVLSFSRSGLRLADLNGDGLSDLVAIRSESVRYWPSRGVGKFDQAVSLPGAPVLSESELAKLHVGDMNGDGLADLTMVDSSEVRYWLNAHGSSLLPVQRSHGTPEMRPTTVVRVADINGNGSADIVWVDPINTGAPWRYLDLLASGGPGLLARIDNGLGSVTTIRYAGLGMMRAWARSEGIEWTRRSSIGQMVVAEIQAEDGLGWQSTTQIRYADAYFDGPTREFRGFARAVEYQLGDSEQPTLVTEEVFDVGDGDEARKGLILSSTRKTEDGAVFDTAATSYEVRTAATARDGTPLRYVLARSEEKAIHELGTVPRVIRSEWDRDQYGNVIFEAAYGEINGSDYLFGDDEKITERSYAISEEQWILDRLATEVVRASDGRRLAEKHTYYDGADLEGLPLGEVTRGAVTRVTSWIEGDYFGVEQRLARDEYGNVVTTLDGRDGRTDVTYDPESHTFAVMVGLYSDRDTSLEWRAEYDRGFGVMTELCDPNGACRRFGYDPLGRLERTVEPGDSDEMSTVRYEYHLAAPLSYLRTERREQSGEPGTMVGIAYVDGLGRDRGKLEEAPGGQWAASGLRQYGSRGWVRFAAHPFWTRNADWPNIDEAPGGVWSEHDAVGRLVVERDADGAERWWEHEPLATKKYDENDTDPDSPHYRTPTTEWTDGLGRLRELVELDGQREVVTRYRYDGLGNVLEVVDPLGHLRRYQYDGRSRQKTVVDP
ncbi:MAG: toxin TcdB middle/N-terminal domain-containing protein, partial [Pseudomonadota bacterium]